jgi:alcohol dehydrogenase (cytochrome c)
MAPHRYRSRSPLSVVSTFALITLMQALRTAAAADETAGLGISFLSDQAEHGRDIYTAKCAACHGDALQGDAGSPLKGIPFQSRWANRTLRELMYVLATQMPPNAPGSLSETEQFEAAAFLLQRNQYRAGDQALDATQAFALLFQEPILAAAKDETPTGPLPGPPAWYGRAAQAGPTDAELLHAEDAQWLMYNRDYRGQRYSALKQINTRTASQLRVTCVFQLGQVGWYQASPVVYNGRLYITGGNGTYAIDAATCRKLWQFDFVSSERSPLLTVNRGVALYRGAVYRTTPSGHLIALDATSGKMLWDVRVCTTVSGHWLAAAPIAFDGRIFIGEAGADAGANSHVYAFDAVTGEHLWTFDLVPTGSQFGASSWRGGSATGGGSTWTSYSLDPEQRALYVPVGNPAPDYNGEARPGDNLFSDSVVALDIDTGRLLWFAQQLPHDLHDWDTAAPPVLFTSQGKPYLGVATKAGWLYLYDRDSHELLTRAEVSSHLNADVAPTAQGVRTCPGNLGGVQWFGPAFSPKSQSLFVSSVEWCGRYVRTEPQYMPGLLYLSGQLILDPSTEAGGWIRRFDAASGEQQWALKTPTPMLAGLTATGGDVLLTGDLNGDFLVVQASSGKVLYRFNTGGAIAGGVSTYLARGRQYVAVASGNASRITWGTTGAATVFVFGLQ